MSSSSRIITSGTALVLCPKIKQHFGVSAALVLQQLHYWLSKENLSYGIIDESGYQWIRNTYEQWCNQIQVLTLSTLRRAFSTLEKNNIILSQRFSEKSRYAGGNQVKFYTINYDQLELVMGDIANGSINRPSRFTEINHKAGDTSQKTTTNNSQNNSKTSQQPCLQKHTEKCSKLPNHLLKTNTLPAQNEHPLYITNTTSENTSKKTSLSEASQQLENTEHSGIDIEIIQPDKPAEREKINIVEDMISFWNKIIEQTPNKIALTPKRSQHLNAAFKQFFNSNLENWEAFCCKIASSKFLMGDVSAFKANLDWSIRFEIIQRILEGGYSFGDRVVNYAPRVNQLNLTPESVAHPSSLHDNTYTQLEKEQESPEAVHIRNEIKHKLDPAIYKSWFEDTDIVCEQSDEHEKKTTIYVPSKFMADRLRTHYRDIVETYFDAIYVGKPLKKESVIDKERTPIEAVTPFVELSATENIETKSDLAPELTNQVTLDIKEQQEIVVITSEEFPSEADGVQHNQASISFSNDESYSLGYEKNEETPNKKSREGHCIFTKPDLDDLCSDVLEQSVLCESQEITLHSFHLTKQSVTLNERHKARDNTEKIKQQALIDQACIFSNIRLRSEIKKKSQTGIYVNIFRMGSHPLNTYFKKRRTVAGGWLGAYVDTKFLGRVIRFLYCKASSFIDSTILDPPLSFYELKQKF